MLEIAGRIVTIDAMGCQTEIATEIINKQADYVLAVKGNQNYLFEDIVGYFDWALDDKFKQTSYIQDETVTGDYGRVEVRRCYASEDISWLRKKGDWKGIGCVVMVESERSVAGAEPSRERRYYISSLSADAKKLNRVIRATGQ